VAGKNLTEDEGELPMIVRFMLGGMQKGKGDETPRQYLVKRTADLTMTFLGNEGDVDMEAMQNILAARYVESSPSVLLLDERY